MFFPSLLLLPLLLATCWAALTVPIITNCGTSSLPCSSQGFHAEVFLQADLTAIPNDLPSRTPQGKFAVSHVCFATTSAYEASVGCSVSPTLCAEPGQTGCPTQSFCLSFNSNGGCSGLAFRFTANLNIVAGGIYTFRLTSADGSRLRLISVGRAASPVIDNDGVHAEQSRLVDVYLDPGTYAVEVEYFQNQTTSGSVLRFDYKGPDTKQNWEIPGSRVVPRVPDRPPQLTLLGGSTTYVQQGARWQEPGVVCEDTEDTQVFARFTPPNTLTTGGSSVAYTCEDSMQHVVSSSRTVEVRGPPSISLLGEALVTIRLDQEFADPGACCQDFKGASLTVAVDGPTTFTVAGRYSRTYSCADGLTGEMVTAVRVIKVDQPPLMTLIGDAVQQVIKKGTYTDPGMLCQDREDGEIWWSASTSVQALPVARVTTSKGNPTFSTCSACYTVVGPSAWVRLDLGEVFIITGLAAKGTRPPTTVRVGSLETPSQDEPACGTLPAGTSTSTSTLQCGSQLAGRFVTLEAATASIEICSVTVSGTSGPGPPTTLSVHSINCGNLGVEGTYVMAASAQGVHPRLTLAREQTPAGSLCVLPFTYNGATYQDCHASTVNANGWCTMKKDRNHQSGEEWSYCHPTGVAERSALPAYEGPSGASLRHIFRPWSAPDVAGAPRFWWSLASGREVARLKTAGSVVSSSSWGVLDGSLTGCTLRVQAVPAQACTWLFGYSKLNNEYECADGYQCQCAAACSSSSYCCTNTCCDSHGGVAKCPANKPQMCAQSWTCATDCSALGGQRKCPSTSGTGPPCSGKSCAATVEKAGTVNTNQAGTQSIFMACVDSMGQRVSQSRIVNVKCEGPNPTGMYGGNKLVCDTVLGVYYKSNADTCASECLASSACEAYEFDKSETTNNCRLKSKCDKRYHSDDNANRQVGYCMNSDHAPEVRLSSGAASINVGETYVDPGARCHDLEDGQPFDATATPNVNSAVPGNYQVSYSCTDSAGQTNTAIRQVTVKGNCLVPTGVANAALTGLCAEGSAAIKHGGLCTLRCAQGYTPSTEALTCTTASALEFNSVLEPSPSCGPSNCTAPKDIDNVKAGSNGPQTCAEGYEVPSGTACTPNCLGSGWPSYVAEPKGLSCSLGVLTPATYKCKKPAGTPVGVLPQPEFVDASLAWTRGPTGDCSDNYQYLVEIRSSPTAAWVNVPACTGKKVSCKISDLQESTTYEFRVMERCKTDAEMNSPWSDGTNGTTSVIPTPEVLFTMPSSDVLNDPGQLMAVFSHSCARNTSSSQKVTVTQTGQYCTGSKYEVQASDIVTSTVTSQGVQLAGERILIITTLAGFFKKGCLITVTMEEGVVQSVSQPAKNSLAYSWNFTYIDRRPQIIVFEVRTRSATDGTFRIQWNEPAQFTCTVQPKNKTTCLQKAVWEVNSVTALNSCDARSSGALSQLSATASVDFQVQQLYPGVEYDISCSGHKLGKSWVLTMPDPATSAKAMEFTTQDASTTSSTLDLYVYVICEDGIERLSRSEQIRQTAMNSGYVAQVLDYKFRCLQGSTLKPGQQARFRVTANTSQDSRIKWTNGPDLNITYVAPNSNQSYAVVQAFRFQICPSADEQTCQDYLLEVRTVDVQFNFQSDNFEVRDNPAPWPPGSVAPGEYIVWIGAEGRLPTSSTDPSFDWTEVQIYLGDTRERFQLPTSYVDGKLQFRFIGQGTSLPLKLAWQGAYFDLNIVISFVPPNITISPIQASLLASATVLEVNFTHVPNCTDLTSQVPAIPIKNGYADPAAFIKILVAKDGQSENLCESGTYFRPGSCWDTATCSMVPASLSNITVFPMVWNFKAKEFRKVQGVDGVSGVTFPPPSITGVEDPVGGGNSDPIDLGVVVNRSEAVLTLTGSGFPKASTVRLQGGRFPGYHAEVIGLNGDAVPLCSGVDATDATHLHCNLSKCINITTLPDTLEVRLFLGDLESPSTVRGRLVLPRPKVFELGPSELADVGPGRNLWLRGRHFTETQCQSQHPDAVQLLGAPGFLNVTFGAKGVPCEVTTQNDTHAVCKVLGKLMQVTVAGYVGGDVPPVQRSATESVIINLGGRLAAVNGDTGSGLPALQVKVIVGGCPVGKRRETPESHTCVSCPRGRWVTALSSNWPFYCETCPTGKYQDQVGASTCKACPDNTDSWEGAVAISDCTCKPGYYSQYVNSTTGMASPGTACLECHSTTLTDLSKSGECGPSDPVVSVCSVENKAACIRDSLGALRVCKAYCAGGTAWPVANINFWRDEDMQLPGDRALPQFARCEPSGACLGENKCQIGYKDTRCQACKFGYWRDVSATNECKPCGGNQGFGELLLVAACAFVVFGGLGTMSAYMRVQADFKFAQEVFLMIQRFVVQPVKNSTVLMRMFGRAETRKTVTVTYGDVGRALSYARDRDLGMVLRVDDQRTVHVAGLSITSPMRGKVMAGWKLQTVDGQRLNYRTEEEVQSILRESKLPLRLTFAVPQRWTTSILQPEEEGAGDLDLTQDRKLVIIMLGILNSFSQAATFDFQWPPIFLKIVELSKLLSFDLNFFRPECTVETNFYMKWRLFLAVPYVMIVPLLLACAVASLLTLTGQRGTAFWTKAWLLMNAFARCGCLVFIFLLPFHLDQLLVPFACVKSSTNETVVNAMPETPCNLENETYADMVQISIGGLLVVLAFFSMLLMCLHMSFKWQGGQSRVRDYIPFYVAMVEVSTFGQRGYVSSVRERVFQNIFSARAFEAEIEKVELRQHLTVAVGELGHRTRRAARARRDAWLGALPDHGEDEQIDATAPQVNALQGKQRFERNRSWPTVPDGNVVTYGWVLIVNLFWRQLVTLSILKLTVGRPAVIGAAFQMLVFGTNAVMLISFRPYQCNGVTRTEAGLLTALFIVLWCAVLKDLLENHLEAYQIQGAIKTFSSTIEALAMTLIGIVFLVPAWHLVLAGKKILDINLGPDGMLNKIYMLQFTRRERERKEAELNRLRELIDRDKDEDTVKILAAKLPQLDEALAHFREAELDTNVNQQEQGRLLLRLAKAVRRMEEQKQRQREIQLAVEEIAEGQMEEERVGEQAEERAQGAS